jgi:hypothetical protein
MIWRGLVIFFVLANLLGAGYAAIAGEAMHCAIHAGLLLLTAIIIWRRSARDVAHY